MRERDLHFLRERKEKKAKENPALESVNTTRNVNLVSNSSWMCQ